MDGSLNTKLSYSDVAINLYSATRVLKSNQLQIKLAYTRSNRISECSCCHITLCIIYIMNNWFFFALNVIYALTQHNLFINIKVEDFVRSLAHSFVRSFVCYFHLLLFPAVYIGPPIHQRPAFCLLPADPGPCRGYFPRYFYNSKTGECERFIYGGCKGNKNNFRKKEECYDVCGATIAVDQRGSLVWCELVSRTIGDVAFLLYSDCLTKS